MGCREVIQGQKAPFSLLDAAVISAHLVRTNDITQLGGFSLASIAPCAAVTSWRSGSRIFETIMGISALSLRRIKEN